MGAPAGLLARFAVAERGGVTIMAAVSLAVLMGFAALAVDVGEFFFFKRRQQGSTDLAAMAAAADLGRATDAARATVGRNGYGAADILSVETGVYTADPGLATGARFVAGGGALANAVRVRMRTTTPMIFGAVLHHVAASADHSSGSDSVTIETQATAATSDIAAIEIGSRLASLDGGIANALLGAMLGSTLSLSVMDYRSLADAKVDLFDFSKVLATNLGLKTVSYSDLLALDVKQSDVMRALSDTLHQSGSGSSLAGDAARRLAVSSQRVKLGTLVDVGPYQSRDAMVPPAQAGAVVSAFDLASGVAQLANGSHQVETALDVAVPGVLSASAKLAIGERPVGSAWVAVGATGTSVHTAQTRLLLTLTLAGSGLVPAVTLPLYVEVASGTATTASVSCGWPDATGSSATLMVMPGLASAWIGSVPDTQFANVSTQPRVAPATLVAAPLFTVRGSASAQVGNLSARPVPFSHDDIEAGRSKVTATSDVSGSLAASLIGNLDLKVTAATLTLPPPPGLATLVGQVLATATPATDRILASTLATLGVSLGQAETTISGLRCDGAVLVN